MKNVCLLYFLLIGLSACGGKKTDSISLSGEIKGLVEKAIFHQSRRLVAEPAAELDVILPSDLEL